jgi:hypothetical protein
MSFAKFVGPACLDVLSLVDGVTLYPVLCEGQTWDAAVSELAKALAIRSAPRSTTKGEEDGF